MLENINSPEDLKRLPLSDLPALADEIRDLIIDTVNSNSGHMSSNLGVVELTIALHRVFDSPIDTLLFDTSHQVYAHKLLTGRYPEFSRMRLTGGLSGFYEPTESEHDPMVIGHAGTGPSAAMGFAVAKRIQESAGYVVCVVGDGSLTCGLAYEGLSNIISNMPLKLMVILNDNGMSISPNVGWLAQWRDRWLPQLRSQLALDKDFQTFEETSERLATKVPLGPLILSLGKGVKSTIDKAVIPNIGKYWDEMGFQYIGPVDGHNIGQLIEVISKAKQTPGKIPFIHVLTDKGKGYPPAEEDPVTFHQPGTPSGIPTYSKVFCDTLEDLMESDQRVVAISAAMLHGTGLVRLKQRYPLRVFDVGVCEQHAVSMAAAMAKGGLRPVVCIYSTFMQRAFDQIIHDVGVNDLPVIFGIDRAGIVGHDGKTHHGVYDLAYMRLCPGMVVSVPKDENEMRHLLYTAYNQNHPFAIRYPRGRARGLPLEDLKTLPIGESQIVRHGKDLCLAAVGPLVYEALAAANELQITDGIDARVVNMRYVKPVDVTYLVDCTDVVVIEEASSVGGLRAAILEAISDRSTLLTGIGAKIGPSGMQVHSLSCGDCLLEHAGVDELKKQTGLTAEGIVRFVRDLGGERWKT